MPNPNTTFTAGQVLTADQQNRLPRGVMAFVNRTTSVSALTTSYSDITGMSVTFTAVSSRLYKFTWSLRGTKLTAAGYTDIQLTDSANVVKASITQYSVTGNFWNCSGSVTLTGLTGSVTYKLRGAAENNTAQPDAQAAAPITLIVEDVGPA
jgi:ABC-type uncharacterized transport system fused permease/ATPase subunit